MVSKIKKFFKRLLQKEPPYNVDHPDFEGKIEAAFVAKGVTYYRFKHDYDMPVGRYKYVTNYLHQVDLRMTTSTLREYIKQIEAWLDGSKQHINPGKALILLKKMESRANLEFDVETVRKLASVVYFDDTEILSTYDFPHNRKKIQKWIDGNVLDFFLTRPISELLKLKNISISSLEEYVQWQEETIKILNSELQNQSKENS